MIAPSGNTVSFKLTPFPAPSSSVQDGAPRLWDARRLFFAGQRIPPLADSAYSRSLGVSVIVPAGQVPS
jgi:hypothetical protein